MLVFSSFQGLGQIGFMKYPVEDTLLPIDPVAESLRKTPNILLILKVGMIFDPKIDPHRSLSILIDTYHAG